MNYQVKKDGLKRWLDYIPARPKNPRTIILLPGLNNLHSMDSYGDYLAGQGFRVRSIKYEGQRERSKHFFTKRKISTASIDEWIQNIDEGLSSLQVENKALAALTYSIGASLLALYLLQQRSTTITSIFAFAPALSLTRRSNFFLGLYRMMSFIVGGSTGIFPTLVGEEYRAEDYMSYNSYSKPKQVIDQISIFIDKQHPPDSPIPWTVVTDPTDFFVNSLLLKTQLRKYNFPNLEFNKKMQK
ncbi:MAG: hypothetical protein AB8G05_01110 [Oligoflexales bacterium]